MTERPEELGLSMDSGETVWVRNLLDLERLLDSSRPESLKLIGDWKDLSKLSQTSGGSVRRLWIRGESINSIEGLAVFQHLDHLLVESSTPPYIDFSGLASLSSVNLQWRDARTLEVLSNAPVSRMTIIGAKGSDLSHWPPSSTLTKLTLTRPSFESLTGIDRLGSLQVLDIRLASKLESTLGISAPLEELAITNAPKLSLLVLGSSKDSIVRVSIFDAPESMDLSELYSCLHIEKIATGGKRSPLLDWKRVLAISSLRHVQGLVDSDFERTLVASGRKVAARRDFGTKNRRWVELTLD